jgi:hypothetical protein
VFRGKTVVSNATRWDTFESMLGEDKVPQDEKLFRWVWWHGASVDEEKRCCRTPQGMRSCSGGCSIMRVLEPMTLTTGN